METFLPVIVITLLTITIIIQIVQIFRKVAVELGPIEQALLNVEKSCERVERAGREEITHNREELANLSRQSREELSHTLNGDILKSVKEKLESASKQIEKAQTRTRIIGKKLKDVQELPVTEARAVLMLQDDLENSDTGFEKNS